MPEFMRILFTTHQGELAGSTFSIIYLVRALAERGHQIHIGVKNGTLLWRELVAIRNVKLHELAINSYLDWRACLRLKEIISENKIEILNAQGGKDRNLTVFAKWVFGLNVQIVFTRRQRPRNEPWVKRWYHTKGTAKIIMISHGLKQIFVNKGYDPDHLHVIYNAVPSRIESTIVSQKVDDLKSKLGFNNEVIIGCLARKKSQEQVLEAFQHLPEHYVGLFVGMDEYEMDASALKGVSQRLHFTGIVGHSEALHYLKLMNVNILPSYLDGFGLTLVESMLLGIPVIGSNFGGIPDVINDGYNGLLFDNGNTKQLAGQIKRLVENLEERNQLVDQARMDARTKFSVARMANDYERFFQSILS